METVPLIKQSSLGKDGHVKTRKTSQNTDLSMQEFLGINKALQFIPREQANNTLKSTEVDWHIEKDSKKLKKTRR